jgi:hypothetical protein
MEYNEGRILQVSHFKEKWNTMKEESFKYPILKKNGIQTSHFGEA